MYPHGMIRRGYVALLHPLPAIVVGVLAICALFGMQLTYSINMISGAAFYLLASIWFLKWRAKYIDENGFLKAGMEKWGKFKDI